MKTKADIIFERLHLQNEAPEIELNYPNNFSLLVAIVLSAQATDKKVNEITKNLFAIASTPQEMLSLGIDELIQNIRSIGLFNSKAKNIIEMSKILVSSHNAEVPKNFDDLVSLPGVGRKSANVFLNVAYGENRIAVDTHVFRVSRRIGLSNGSNVLDVEKDLQSQTSERWLKYASMWLVLHGRYICKAKKPLCTTCIISDICDKNFED